MHICEARIGHFVFCTGWLGGLSAQEFFFIDFAYSTLHFVPTCLFYTGWLDSSEARKMHVDGALGARSGGAPELVVSWAVEAGWRTIYWCKLAGK